jgi:hypothetical protein
MGAIANTRLMILGSIVAAAHLLRCAGAFWPGWRSPGDALEFGGGVLRPERGAKKTREKTLSRVASVESCVFAPHYRRGSAASRGLLSVGYSETTNGVSARLHPPGRTDRIFCRCFGAPARRVFPDHLIRNYVYTYYPPFERAVRALCEFALTTCAPSVAHATAGFTSPSGACSACASPIFVESASPPGTACAALGALFCPARAPRGCFDA